MQWEAIFAIKGGTFVNLQYDDCRAELKAARQQFGVEIHAIDEIDLLNDLGEAAALTAALDVVISPDTSVAAMAGAVGKPVLEFSLSDNWSALGGDRMPWFPNTMLFVRNWREPWDTVLALLASKLEKIISSGQ